VLPGTKKIAIGQSDEHGRRFQLLLGGRAAGFPGWRRRS
jgi:hypothetical protein